MAPFAALLSAATLFAAIDGMRMQREELRLQRRELVLQRRELADSRKVMQEQAEAAKRSAETQERLAKSQAELADAQREANIVACLGHQGPVVAAAAHIDALIAAAKLPGMQGNVQREHISRHEEIRNQLATHLNEILTVQHALIEQRRAARKG